MPVDLGQVLGGILAAIAEARSLGDRYSRALAVEYEKENLMRAFPVPRAEIADIEMSLRLAIDRADAMPSPEIVNLVETTTTAATQAVASVVSGLRVRRKAASIEKLIKPTIEKEIETRTIVATALPGPEIVKGFDVDSLIQAVANRLKEEKVIDSPSVIQEQLTKRLEPIRVAHEEGIKDLRARQLFTGRALLVRVTHSELAEIDPSILSNIKMTINLRNYEWTQVNVKGDEPVLKLVPE